LNNFQVDFKQVNTLVSIATKGDGHTGTYVKNYNVLISSNCSVFEELMNSNGSAKVKLTSFPVICLLSSCSGKLIFFVISAKFCDILKRNA